MSQRFFPAVIEREGQRVEVEVMTGWDRPLQHHYLTVFLAPAALTALGEAAALTGENPTEVEEVLYSSMYDRAASCSGGLSIADIESRMRDLGVAYPPTLMEDLQTDAVRNAGNERWGYEESGGERPPALATSLRTAQADT